jgi:hypothetical protein
MKTLRKLTSIVRRFFRWYREPIPGSRLIRVDPITVLTLIGLATTAWGVGRGLGVEMVAQDLAQTLRNAPAMLQSKITQAHKADQLSGYQREVALERVDFMTPIFNQLADTIELKGYEAASEALANGLFESLMALGPGEKAGRLVGGLATGKGIDQLVGLLCIANSIEEFELIATPFSGEEDLLRKRIEEIFGMDADALFKARMRSKINFLRQEWTDKLKNNPCNPDQAMEEYRTWAYQRARIWAEVPRLYGEGEKWDTYDAFLDWLITEARGEGGKNITMTWNGDFNLGINAKVSCFACVPPSLSGTIQLIVNLETCQVTGEIKAEGEGNVTINDCDAEGQPLEETCTSHGTMKFSGTITGSASHTGSLSLDPTTVTINHSHAWIAGCDWASRAVQSETWDDQITISGELDWEGTADGRIQYSTNACDMTGSWDANIKR